MKYLFCLFAFLCTTSLLAQDVRPLKGVTTNEDYENVKVIPLYQDSDVSTYVIYTKKGVALHYHAEHTEQVIVFSGKGVMTLGNETIPLKKGDYVVIPKNVAHSVRVKGRKPLKVLSIQAPEFKGKDRIFIE